MAGQESVAPHRRSSRSKKTTRPYRRDHSPAGGRILRGVRSVGPMPANRYLSRPDIVRSGASRRRHALPRLALLRPDRSIDLHHQPVRLALGRLERGLQRNLEGLRFGSRQRGRLHRAFNDFRRLTGSRRELRRGGEALRGKRSIHPLPSPPRIQNRRRHLAGRALRLGLCATRWISSSDGQRQVVELVRPLGASTTLISPKVLEPVGRHVGIPDGVLNVLVA